MGILTWIIVGAIAGWLASLIMKGGGYGLIGNIIIGIVGAFVGGWLSTIIFNLPFAVTGFNLTSVIVATVGAIVVLFILSLFRR
jgi:uncharacterized membrane protein YeaQ/YmgE (transglycosylase-associated protein family)